VLLVLGDDQYIFVFLVEFFGTYGACPKNETSRFFFFFLGPLAFCSGPIM